MVIIIDYGRGNLFSLSNALKYIGCKHKIIKKPEKIDPSDKLILPGVGAYKDAILQLNKLGFYDYVKLAANEGSSILGICLGMQLFSTKSSEFGLTSGFDLINGEVKKLELSENYNIPNMGWRKLINHNKIENGISFDKMMYFVHSYAFYPNDIDDIVASIKLDNMVVPAIVKKNNILGCQFHPEKSGSNGLDLLNWFIKDF